MPTYQLLTDRTLAQASAITPTTLIHIVTTGDTSQNSAGSSYKAQLGQLVGLFSGSSDTLVTGGTYSAGTITFTNNTGGTFNVTGLTEPFTGGTVNGTTLFTGGLSANTFSATTYLNLPIDVNVTGGTYSAGTITFTNNTGGTFNVTGLTTGSTTTVSGDFLPLSGGTVSGATNFTNGLTANTFSASSIFVNGIQITGDTFVTGGTFLINTLTFTNNQGNTFQITGITSSGTTFTGGSGNCITDLYVENIHGCTSAITIYDSIKSSGSTVTNQELALSYGIRTSATTSASTALNYETSASGVGSLAQGANTLASNTASHAEGVYSVASGIGSHSEGGFNIGVTIYSGGTASGRGSHAEGALTFATGNASHAEGVATLASGIGSHAEGGSYGDFVFSGGTASGRGSHAEGFATLASGIGSHAEGNTTTSIGAGSHAEGSGTTAYGDYSHTAGASTYAKGNFQSVIGMFNLTADTTQGAFIIGNGTSDLNRSNLLFAAGNEVNISGKTITTNFQMTSGATNGYVLTSDASGNASWQNLSGGTTFTGGSGNCIADLYVTNIHSCSPLNINPLNEGNVYFGSTSGVTIDVINSRIGIGTQSPSESLDVSGKIKTINFQMSSGATNGYVLTSDASGNASWQTPTGGSLTFTGGSVSGATIFTGGLSANTMSATTYLNLPAGVFGISDSSGVYSYYSTLQSAINSANSGDTIQMFSNVLETSATTVNLKNGVNINMNGYTYTLSQTSSDQCLSDNNVSVNCKIYNGNINRSGSTYVNDITSLCLYIINSNSVIETNGVYFNTTSTTGINNAGTLKGAIVNSYARGIVNSGKLYSVNATATIETGIYCDATTSEVYDSIGRSLGLGYGIGMLIPSFNGVLSNSIGYSVAQSGIYAANISRMQSCIGYSSSNSGIVVISSVAQDCKGYSSAGIGATLTNVLSGINILGYSFSSIGVSVSVPTNGVVSIIENLTAESLSNIGALLNATGTGILTVKNLQANSQLSGVLGYSCRVSGNNNIRILGGSLTSYNSSECINATAPITLKYANLTLKTSASPAVNSNITQGITFSADSQGNIVTT